MKAGDDPRSGTHSQPPDNSKPRPAEGGAGTGTKTDPVKNDPASAPGKQS